MNQHVDDENALKQGSVRSLPPSRMQDIKRMFGEKSSKASTPPSNVDNKTSQHDEAQVRRAQQMFAADNAEEEGSQIRKWRQHACLPKYEQRSEKSPVRKPRITISPSRNSKSGEQPVPTPRKSITHRPHSGGEDTSHGLSDTHVDQVSQTASCLGEEEDDSQTNRVSALVNRFKANEESVVSQLKQTNQLKNPSSTPNRSSDSTLERRRRNLSPGKARPITDNPAKVPVYAKLWEKNATRVDSDSEQLNSCTIETKDEEEKICSVTERSKMFEETAAQSSATPARPVKPPPPMRQRSLTEGKNYERPDYGKTPLRPSQPPARKGSFTEKKTEEKHSFDMSHMSKSLDVDSLNEDLQKSPILGKKLPPPPPSKPPRNYAHDDYIRVKLEKEKEASSKQVKIIDKPTDVVKPPVDHVPDHPETETTAVPPISDKKKPLRPPPPRKKPRPFSIATDTIRSNEDSDSDETKPAENGFYEVFPGEYPDQTDPIKHWDLPRSNHPEPIRRSLSDDCLHKAVDDRGNVVYIDPTKLNFRDDFDIYIDSQGYAVPSRLIKRDKTPSQEDQGQDTTDAAGEGHSRPIGDRVKSKFKKFKNLFSENEKPSKNVFDRRSSSKKIKVDAIRQKVNQAFDSVRPTRRRRSTVSDGEEEEGEEEDNISTGSDTPVDEKVIRKRVEYSRSVRIKTSQSIKESRKYSQKIYPQLFEHAMIVGLEFSQENNVYEPVIRYKFPEIRNYKLTMEGKLYPCSELKDTNVSVPLFCFPDAANFKTSSSSAKSQSYNFVLTNFDGGRVFGYCRRLVPPKSPQKIPEVICIISPVDAFVMYNTLLEEIEKKRLVSQDAAQELIAAAFGRPLPSPGQAEIIRTLDENGDMETIFLNRETDCKMDNVDTECLLTSLGSDKFLKVFSSILLERSVLFCAKQLSTLSSTIHAITSLLYPLSWQHTFIPVLPAAMIDVVCSPTPFIIGITTALLQPALELPLEENVLIVDLDKKVFVRSVGDEGTLLPKKVEKALKTSLNMCRIDADARSSPHIMISEAFLRFFVEAIGHYGQFIDTKPGGQSKYFRKEDFVNGAISGSFEQLLEWLVETQMFEVFITNQLEKNWGDTIEFFQSRIQEHLFANKNYIKKQLARKFQQ